MTIEDQVIINFAFFIYKDVQKYIIEHQTEYQEWLVNQEYAKR